MLDSCVAVGVRTPWPAAPQIASSRGLWTDPRLSFGAATRVCDIASIESRPQRAREGAPTSKPRVLLVEDNPGALEMFASFLRTAGFDVALAPTGAAGLMAALAGGVHAVVADLCPPATPELKARATELGASAFLPKPIDGDDLVRAVRSGIQTEPSSGRKLAPVSLPAVGRMKAPSQAMADIVAFVTELAPTDVNPRVSSEIRQRLVGAVVATIVRLNLAVCELLACAEALRRVVTSGQQVLPAELIEQALEALALQRPPVTRQPYHPKVVEALARLASPDGTGLCMSEQNLGHEIGISGSRLGRLLDGQTGLTFREWRRGFRMRHAVLQLAAIEHDVYQIADSLGYKHASQFDDEFRDTFGLSPRALRTTLRAATLCC